MQLEPFACDDDIRRTSSCDRVSNKTNTAKASVAHLTRVLDLLDPPPDLKESSSSSVFFLLCEDTSGEVPEEVEGLAIAQDGRTDTRAKFNIERRIFIDRLCRSVSNKKERNGSALKSSILEPVSN